MRTPEELETAIADMQALCKLAEQHRRERATMPTAPIKGVVDYAAGGVAVDQGWTHLNESIVHGQRLRTEAAAELVVQGLYHTLVWLRAAGYNVPVIVWEPGATCASPGCPQHAEPPVEEGAHLGFQQNDVVTVYDRYRFALPLAGIVRQLSDSNDGVEVRLLQSNSPEYPVGSNVWVSARQLRMAEAAKCAHVLYTTADADRPSVICDANGEVVLSLCKLCGKAEAELLEPLVNDNMARRGWATKRGQP